MMAPAFLYGQYKVEVVFMQLMYQVLSVHQFFQLADAEPAHNILFFWGGSNMSDRDGLHGGFKLRGLVLPRPINFFSGLIFT